MRYKYHTKENKKAFLFPQEWKQLIDILKPKQMLYFQTAINTGARIEEIRHIKIKDYQRTPSGKPILTLRVTKVRAKIGETKPTPRTFSISKDFYHWIKRYHRKHKNLDINSTPGTNKALKKALKDIGKENWKDFSSHNIRKTHGNWLLAIGVDPFEICNRLGHNLETLRNHYASPDIFTQEDKEQIRNILGDLYT